MYIWESKVSEVQEKTRSIDDHKCETIYERHAYCLPGQTSWQSCAGRRWHADQPWHWFSTLWLNEEWCKANCKGFENHSKQCSTKYWIIPIRKQMLQVLDHLVPNLFQIENALEVMGVTQWVSVSQLDSGEWGNLLETLLMWLWQLIRVAKTCRPCRPVGANFFWPVLIFGKSTRKIVLLCPWLLSLMP